MTTLTRTLRTICEDRDRTMQDRTPREQRQFDRIMKCAPALLTFWPSDRISFSAMATAMKFGANTLRKHFVDIPSIIAYLIREHLCDITTGISGIPFNTPDHYQRRRAAYLRVTRKPLGAHTEIHLLMLNNLPALPDDLRLPLLQLQDQIARLLAPSDQAGFVLSMLENPYITPRRLEAIIATPEYAWHETTEAPQQTPALEPPGAGSEPEIYVPDADDDLSRISGVKIPGGGIWLKPRQTPPENPREPEPGNAIPGAAPPNQETGRPRTPLRELARTAA